MDWIALLARLLLTGVFLVAAVAKFADRRGSREALTDFGVPSRLAAPAAVVLPIVELGIAALLMPTASARWGAFAALGLLGLFVAGMTVSLARGKKPNCHCFGQLHSAPIGWSTLLRNGFLAAMAGVVLWRGGENPDFASLVAGAGFSAAAWIALAVALTALALAASEAWLLLNLLPQQGRLLTRLETAEAALRQAGISGLSINQKAPEFELRGLTGDRVSLATLRSLGQPVLLFFTNPDCAPCDTLLPEVARWQREHGDRVSIAVISQGSIGVNQAKADKHGLRAVLLQKEDEVTEAYQVDGTPAAILVGAEGRVASRIAYGAEPIERLLQQAVTRVVFAPAEFMPGGTNGHRDPPDLPAPTIAIGQSAPRLTLNDLEGRTTDLADLQGTATLILFWSPGCGFCQQMLPELKKWERKRPAGSPNLLVVSRGTLEANRAMGLVSPVVLDSDGSAMRAFGAGYTPMAVLVDADGKIASSVVVGAQEVMALARTRQNRPVGKLRRSWTRAPRPD